MMGMSGACSAKCCLLNSVTSHVLPTWRAPLTTRGLRSGASFQATSLAIALLSIYPPSCRTGYPPSMMADTDIGFNQIVVETDIGIGHIMVDSAWRLLLRLSEQEPAGHAARWRYHVS